MKTIEITQEMREEMKTARAMLCNASGADGIRMARHWISRRDYYAARLGLLVMEQVAAAERETPCAE